MRNLIFIFILAYGVSIHAQSEYSLCGTVEKEGLSLEQYGALLFADSCTFYIADSNGMKITPDHYNWDFEIAVEKGRYLRGRDVESPVYGIRMDNLRYGEDFLDFKYQRIILENDSSVYYLGKVIFEGDYKGINLKLEKEFYINLLPSIPQVKVLDATWSNYDEQLCLCDDGVMTMQINSFNSNRIYIVSMYIDSNVGWGVYFDPNIDKNKGIGTYDFWATDTYLEIWTSNDCGSVMNQDTLWTSDIVSSIISSIPDVKQSDNVPFYPNPAIDLLYVPDSNVFPIHLYDSCGKLMKVYEMPIPAIDVSTLKEGSYLLIYQDKTMGRKKAFKMIKN